MSFLIFFLSVKILFKSLLMKINNCHYCGINAINYY